MGVVSLPSYVNEESASLLRSEGGDEPVHTEPFCTPNRFTIITLSSLVVVLSMVLLAVIMGPMCTDQTVKSVDPIFSPTPSNKSIPVKRFGLISDIHLDLSIENCLHFNSTLYRYGIFGCDSPVALVNEALKSLSKTLESVEHPFVLLLGDLVGHKATSKEATVSTMDVLFNMLDASFPAVPVLPVIGNNDLPVNYEVPEQGDGWYQYLLPLYKASILKGEGVRLGDDFDKTFLYGGFYRVHLPNNITVVGLHTLLWYKTVPAEQAKYGAGQLRWFQELMKALGEDEKVIIIGHIPPGLSLYHLYKDREINSFWAPRYTKIFARACHNHYEQVIGVFFGHVHEDSFRVENHWKTQMAMFTIPSVSPVYQGQPAFSVGELDHTRSFVDLVTHHTWLDYYSRVDEELRFKAVTSLSNITNVEELSGSNMKVVAQKFIDERDNQTTHNAMKNRWYQDRYSPEFSPHMHYCFVTSLNGDDFSECIAGFSYNISKFVKVY